MRNRVSLRFRLTLTSIIITTSMCILLTLGSLNSAEDLSASVVAYAAVVDGQGVPSAVALEQSLIGAEPAAMMDVEMASYTQEAMGQFQSSTVVSMIILVVLSSLLTYYYAGKALKPLEILSKEVKNRNVGNLEEDIVVPDVEDEIKELTESFNEMTTKIHQSYSMQKKFSANVAHELRTPLTVLQTKLDVFLMKERALPEYKEFIGILNENVERLCDIVKNLLEFTNEAVIDMKQSFDIRELMEEVLFELEELAAEKKIEIAVSCEVEHMNGNDGLMQQIIYNLVENAIKYNRPNGSIDIGIQKDKQGILITVADTGYGIPEEYQQTVFDPFVRVDPSRNREIAGSGLGLAIVKSMVEKHNGTITVYPNKPQGTCFAVWILQ